MRKILAPLIVLCSFLISSLPAKIQGDIEMRFLKNKLTVISKRTKTNNIVGIVCLIRVGSAFERAEENGISSLTQALLMKGTNKHSASELALALEREGIFMNTDASEDFVSVSVAATADQIDRALELLSEVLFEPSFPADELEKERRNAIAQINLVEDDKFYLSFRNLREILYEGHPYSQPTEGRPESLLIITKAQIEQFHNRFYQPENMTLAIVGNVPRDELNKCVNRHFGSRVSQEVNLFISTKTFNPVLRTREIKKPLEQGFLTMGYIGAPMNHKDYPALRVACAILGEGMASRFFTQLRDQRGLAYAVGGFYQSLRLHGAVIGYIGTRPETLEVSNRAMRHIFEDLAENPIHEDELNRAKNYLIGKYLIAHQTNLKKANYLAWFHCFGLGVEFDEKYPELIMGVKIKDVRRVARKYFKMPAIVTLSPESKSQNKSE